MTTSDEPRQPTLAFDAALDYTRHGIAVLPVYWPITPDPRAPGAQRYPRGRACSCGDPDCPTPAAHPIKPATIADATTRVTVVTQWFQAHPYANIATVAGATFDVIEVPYQGPTAPLLDWLATQPIPQPCPIIDSGHGLLHFPVSILPPATSVPLTQGSARRLAPGTLVLLPPSRHLDRAAVTWRRRFDERTSLLPDAARMLRVLAALPAHDPGAPGSGSGSGPARIGAQ
jgi:hypothetical protein